MEHYKSGMLDSYKRQANLELWAGFQELTWGLWFEMSEREEKWNTLYFLEYVSVFFARPKCRKLQSGHVGCCNNKM